MDDTVPTGDSMVPSDVAYPAMFRRMANKIALIYLVVGGGWILFSDRILSWFVTGAATLTTLQTVKGWLFIVVTDLLLYVLLLRNLSKIEHEIVLRGESENRAQAILMTVPVAIVEVDLVALKEELDMLKKQGGDLEQYLAANPEVVDRLLRSVTVKSMNSKTLEFFGAESPSRLLDSLDRIFPSDSLFVFRDMLLAIFSRQECFQAEIQLTSLKGEPRCGIVSMAIPPLKSRFANIPLSITDITERKKIEENLLLFQLTLQQVEEGITITTAQLEYPGPEILYVNAAFTRMTGYTSEEVIGLTPRILQGPKTDRSILDQVRQALWQRQVFRGETVNYRKDGSEFLMEWYVVPLVNKQFQVTNFVAVQRDITPKK